MVCMQHIKRHTKYEAIMSTVMSQLSKLCRYSVKGIWYPDWLVSSQRLVMFASLQSRSILPYAMTVLSCSDRWSLETLCRMWWLKDRDSFIGPQEFVVGYSNAHEQPQSSARPICRSHTMTSTRREPATIRSALVHIGASRTAHCATGDLD